jgi:hypothetical protein
VFSIKQIRWSNKLKVSLNFPFKPIMQHIKYYYFNYIIKRDKRNIYFAGRYIGLFLKEKIVVQKYILILGPHNYGDMVVLVNDDISTGTSLCYTKSTYIEAEDISRKLNWFSTSNIRLQRCQTGVSAMHCVWYRLIWTSFGSDLICI